MAIAGTLAVATKLQALLGKLRQVTQTGPDSWKALCPAHDDKNPSLSITLEGEKILIHCFAGCEPRAILKAIGEDWSALFMDKPQKPRLQSGLCLSELAAAKKLPVSFLTKLGVHDSRRGKPHVCIPYYNENGEKIAVRLRHALTGDKRFSWRRGDKPCLYGLWRLPEIRKAGWVLLVEGESDCWTAWFHDIPALGIPGKGCWKSEWASYLDGLGVYLWREPDAADLVERVAKDLPNLRVVRPPGGIKDLSELHLKEGENTSAVWEDMLNNAQPANVVLKTEISRPSNVKTTTWEDVAATFTRWLELADLDPVKVVLATVVANRMPGDPVWLFLVAPPSSAKTEIINSLSALPDVYTLSTLTPQTFLSGKEASDHKGDTSLLPQLTNKILTIKDLAPILEMRSDTRQAIFSQLRDIYDGRFERAVGSEKRTMRWEGKIGLIVGITQALDQYTGFSALLGERFLMYRIPPSDAARTFSRSLLNVGREKEMRKELREVVANFLASISIGSPQDFLFPEDIQQKLQALVFIVTRARTGVGRDWYGKKEITYVSDPEGPARLTKQLALLAMGLATLRGTREVSLEDYRIVYKVGLDSLHKFRRAALALLAEEREWTTAEVAMKISLPTDTAQRFLEDLTAVGLLERRKAGTHETAPNIWRMRDEVRVLWEKAQP